MPFCLEKNTQVKQFWENTLKTSSELFALEISVTYMGRDRRENATEQCFRSPWNNIKEPPLQTEN